MNPALLLNLFIIIIGWSMMNKFGLITSQEDKKNDEEFRADSKFVPFAIMFNPQLIFEMFQRITQKEKDRLWNKYHPKQEQYEALINQVLSSKKALNDNEDALINVFKNIGSRSELAWFTWKFKEYWDNNPIEMATYYLEFNGANSILGNFLASFLDPEDITRLKTQLKKLKNE